MKLYTQQVLRGILTLMTHTCGVLGLVSPTHYSHRNSLAPFLSRAWSRGICEECGLSGGDVGGEKGVEERDGGLVLLARGAEDACEDSEGMSAGIEAGRRQGRALN